MPSRHSQNAGDRHHFTYREREGCGYGTQRVRFGKDSQLPFGNCALCLQPSKEPMATPSGHIYCRECILSYLLKKTKELRVQREAYEIQQKNLQLKNEEEINRKEALENEAFMKKQEEIVLSESKSAGAVATRIIDGSSNDSNDVQLLLQKESSPSALVLRKNESNTLGKRSQVDLEEKRVENEKKRALKELSRKVDTTTVEEHRDILKRTSFWLPAYTPEHSNTTIQPPETRPRSPMSSKTLRVKDLIPLNFKTDGGETSEQKIICAVSQKQINFQPVVLIATTGQVMLRSAYEQFVEPTMICPITGRKFKKSDVVDLVRGASGFSASGSVESSKYEPVMM